MGIGGISIWQLLIILVIVVLIFGTKRLKNMGGDLGGAVKGFKDAMSDNDKDDESEPKHLEAQKTTTLEKTAVERKADGNSVDGKAAHGKAAGEKNAEEKQ